MVFENNTLKELLKEKNISDTKGLQELMRKMYKEVIEGVMEGELTAHLGYPRHLRTHPLCGFEAFFRKSI